MAGAGPGRRALRLAARAQSTGRRFVNPRVWGRRLAGRRAADKLRRGSDVPTRDLDERRQNVNPFYHRIYRVVRHIPKGRVATYGLVARLAGRPGAARTVGWALSALPEDADVPWWRVLNAAGRISLSGAHHASVLQRALLLREGVKFAPGGAVSLATFGWAAARRGTKRCSCTRAGAWARSRS